MHLGAHFARAIARPGYSRPPARRRMISAMRSVTHIVITWVLLAALLAASGTASGATSATARLAPGSYTRSVTMDDGWKREYLLRVPPGKARPRPVVIALHGGLNDMQYIRDSTGFDALADEKGFVTAYPNGFFGTWNAGGCCWFARMAGIDDVGFLDRLIDTLVREGLADPRRIYLTGFSNGGGMAYRYACERSTRIAAIGVVSGSLAVPCEPERPVSLIAVHGTADPSVPFGGGGDQDWNNHVPFPPVQAVMDFWRSIDRLPPLDRIVLDAASTVCRTSLGAVRSSQVEFCTIFDGGHTWPDGTGKGVAASPLIWDFFTKHVRP